MIIIKQDILIIDKHEFLNTSDLINVIKFFKDTDKGWNIFYQICGI